MTSISDTEVVNAPGGLVELGYAEITNTITVSTTTEGVNGQSIIPALTVVCDGSPIIVEFVAHRVQTGINSGVVANLIVDGANQGRITFNASSTGGELLNSAYGAFRLTPSAGTHTFAITAFKTGSPNGYVWNDSGSRTFLRVSKIIQASQLLVTQSNAPIVTSLPAGNLVTGQEVDLYVTSPYAGYQRHKWNGSAWYMVSDSRACGPWQSWSPTISQNNVSIAYTSGRGRYLINGKMITAMFGCTMSGTGTSGFTINFTLPTPAFSTIGFISGRTGIFHYYRSATGFRYTGILEIAGTNTAVLVSEETGGNALGASPAFAVGANDQVGISMTYEVD